MIYLLRRFSAVSCIMLSACAAAGGGLAGGPTPAGTAYGAFLAARYADAQQDPAAAVKFYGQALAAEPDNKALINEGFLAAAVSGSPQAPQLARQISSNALAMMMLGNQAAMDGDFTAAGAQFARLPGQDLSGLLSPLLIAWADCGAGNPQAALALLQPLITGNSAFAGIYRLNAALIADQNHDMKDASVYYGNTANIGDAPNLRLAQIVASWQARQGNLDAARAVLAQMAATHPGLAPALPGLQAQMAAPVIRNPADGLAEAYLTVAGSLNLPDQSILRLTFLRFAITLRPDLSAARLLLASALTATDAANPKAPPPSQGALRQALDVLQPVAPTDPLYSTAVLQEADLMSSLHEVPQAVSLLDKLLANDPKNLDALE
ncbi:MAG: hypothetical protein POG74_07770, partial [Acidocella sp.]|nr:hypothetical protein [Acidocella sp.]